jgi:plasmid stability protein
MSNRRLTAIGSKGRDMCFTCDTVEHMSKMIQIRNVPDELHRKLKVRAAERGTSLSDFLLAEVEEIADRPTVAELMERLAVEEPVDVDEPPEVTIRRLRETG